MKLSRSKETEALLFDKFRAHLARDVRDGVHVSDLVSPRLAYWKRKKPLPLTEDECLYFLGGIAHHTMIVAALTGETGSEEAKIIDEETGVAYSPDLYTLKGEFKTTRMDKLPQSEEEAKRRYAEYIKQCRMYAALMHTLSWKLIVFFFSVPEDMGTYVRKKPKLRAYELLFTEAELERERKKIAEQSALFTAALAEESDKALPLCVSWKCYESVDGVKIGTCPYWHDCKPETRYEQHVVHSLEETL